MSRQLPNNIRNLRLINGLSGTAVAELLNMSPQYYYDLETGRRRLNADHIQKLTTLFKCSSDELLGNTAHSLTSQPSKELCLFLDQPGVTFDGKLLTDDDKEKVRKALELAFWDTSQQFKRKNLLKQARNFFAIFFCQAIWELVSHFA